MSTCSEEICMHVMAQEGTREYLAIPKGREFVYAYANQLYHRVKTEGRTKYLKCRKVGCDGSAKIVGDLFFLGYVHVDDTQLYLHCRRTDTASAAARLEQRITDVDRWMDVRQPPQAQYGQD